MASYLVLNPPGTTGKDERAKFIRDGFSLFGLLFPLIYLLWHRLWLAAVTLFAAILAAEIVGSLFDLGIVGLVLDGMAGLYIGLEGGNLKASVLKSSGWSEQAVISAENLDDAEALYFGRDTHEPTSETTPQSFPGKFDLTRLAHHNRGPALGLLNPYGGR